MAEYRPVPCTEAVASNWVVVNGVSYTMSAGLFHEILGIVFVTLIETLANVAV
jgi:hypothetical protein